MNKKKNFHLKFLFSFMGIAGVAAITPFTSSYSSSYDKLNFSSTAAPSNPNGTTTNLSS
jgi:spermidine/putrescine-binding protein